MKSKVRNALMKISDKFAENLSDKLKIKDIVLTGSLSNYNWSKYSDFDLHLIIDYSQFGKQEDLYKELFSLKKQLFNQNHDIKIFGYEVELYAQDSEEAHFATGVYSVKDDKWVSVPSKKDAQIDKEVFKTKINSWKEKIENLITNIKKDGMKSSEKQIENLKDKLKDYRKTGLEKEGEYSYENLVFKYLRRSNLIEKLYNTITKQTDKELSVEIRKVE
jgi:predicted nucleotidyltransferase/Txe/YoeB family toxin of Txe-Axe toxin-antitoxin module